MGGVPMNIIERQVGHFHLCDPAYGAGVAKRMKLDWKPAKAMAAE